MVKLSEGMPPPPEVLICEIIASVSVYLKNCMKVPFSTRPTDSTAGPIFVPCVQALYISVVDRSDIFENDISVNAGRPAVRSVLAMSCCIGRCTPCEYEWT